MDIQGHDILGKTTELEHTIQSTAFEMLRQRGAYDQAQQLLVVASDVGKLKSRLQEILEGKVRPRPSETPPRRTPKPKRTSTSRYPIFFISEDRLCKLGKGKQKTAKEYRHEAARSSFDAVARWIQSALIGGSVEWTAKSVDDDLAGKVPSYQTYLILAALQSIGVLNPTRRGYYTVASDSGQPQDWWNALLRLPAPTSQSVED